MIENNYYEAPLQNWWQGRKDGLEWQQQRWHQRVKPLNVNEVTVHNIQKAIVFLGFACEEGVIRNQGRMGAAAAPAVLRNICSNLPVHFSQEKKMIDVGNVVCVNENLEEAQNQLSKAVSSVLLHGGIPILLGGGHEIVYGNYLGIQKAYPERKIGIINVDAHFDLRQPDAAGASSGTGFFQIAKDNQREGKEFLYLPIGIQQAGNTVELFERAKQLGVPYILAQEVHFANLEKIKHKVKAFLSKTDLIYLTIDMDAFASAYAPGVSAPTANGLVYDATLIELLKMLAQSGKVVLIDVAELNPAYDIDNRTAKLAANILFDWLLMQK